MKFAIQHSTFDILFQTLGTLNFRISVGPLTLSISCRLSRPNISALLFGNNQKPCSKPKESPVPALPPLLSATADKGVQAKKQGQCNRPYSCNPRWLLLNAKLRQFERSTERSRSQEKLRLDLCCRRPGPRKRQAMAIC